MRHPEVIPATYRDLCEEWLPRPVPDKATNAEATGMVDALAGFPLNDEREDYVEAVSYSVTAYEGNYVPKVTGLDLLKSLVDDHELTGADLSRLPGDSRLLGATVLRGERRITADHARKLGARFKLDPGAFL